MNTLLRTAFSVALAFLCTVTTATTKEKETPVPDKYFTLATDAPAVPDNYGFIRRWTLLEPISKPNGSNRVFTDDYLRAAATTPYFKDQFTLVPYNGEKTAVGKKKLIWHALDSKDFYINLLRFAQGYDKEFYGQAYWVVTTIHCDKDLQEVRLASGTNSAAVWYVDGQETLLMSNDRDLIVDDCMSKRLTLTKGDHVIRGVIFTGPGMATFCLRIVDKNGAPVKDYTISSQLKKKK